MNNPYSPSTANLNALQASHWPVILWWSLAIAVGALVSGNYLTATATYWQTNPLMNWVFTTSPFAIASQISLLRRKPSTVPVAISILVAVTVILSLGYAWSSWFSPNPYEEFILTNVFWGPYGWIQWMWLAMTGLMPLQYLVRWIREQLRLRQLLATMTILAYVHNAVYVIHMSHDWP